MFSGIIAGFQTEARFALRRLVYALGGLVFILIGLCFLIGAVWIALAELRDPLFATLVVGAIFFGIGLILLGVSRRAYRSRDIRLAAETAAVAAKPGKTSVAAIAMVPVAEAFITGLAAGMRRTGRHPDP